MPFLENMKCCALSTYIKSVKIFIFILCVGMLCQHVSKYTAWMPGPWGQRGAGYETQGLCKSNSYSFISSFCFSFFFGLGQGFSV